MFYFAGALMGLSFAVLGAPRSEEIEIIEKRTIANRLAMRQWCVQVTFAIEGGNARTEPNAPVPTGYTCYVDGERIRVDSTFRYANKPPGIKEDSFTSTTIWNDDENIMYGTRRFEDGATASLEIADREWSLREEHNGKIRLPPIQTIGILPGGLLINQPMTECVGNPNRTKLDISTVNFKDVECKKISFISEDGLPTRVWVAPALGPSVVRMEHDWKSKSHSYLDRTDVVVKEHRKTGIWFPESAEWRRIQDGKATTMREKVQVEILSLNEPLEERFFTVAALDVPVGSFVNRRPWVGSFIWDGEQVREQKPSEILRGRASEVGTSGRRVTFLLTSLLLAILCGVLLWGRFVRQ